MPNTPPELRILKKSILLPDKVLIDFIELKSNKYS